MNPRWLSFLGILVLLVTHSTASDYSIANATPETFVGGPENLKLVAAAKTITVFRILDSKKKQSGHKLVTIDKQQCEALPSVVSGPEVTQVIEALNDMSNFGVRLICDFDPGVILRFTAEGRNLDLMICFHCGEMILYSGGAVIQRPYEWAATRNTFRRNAYRAFAATAKKAFPDDAELKKLKELSLTKATEVPAPSVTAPAPPAEPAAQAPQ